MTTRPRIAMTMGDPAGVGPELCLKVATDARVLARCVPIIVGDAEVLARVGAACGLAAPQRVVSLDAWPDTCRRLDAAAVLDCRAIAASDVRPGEVDAVCGRASYVYIDRAIAAAMAGEVDGVATAPIHKEALRRAGIDHPGHTEIFAEKSGAARIAMMLTAEPITVSLVTTHIGYRDVADRLTTSRIVDVIELTHEAMRRMRGREPRLVVCGLNPHAGEHGLFGSGEEERIIAPAVAAARQRSIDVEGPLPPDTAFVPGRLAHTDAYVCMYHDQGLIPLKLLAFDTAVNVTLGLPIVRTSADHGTAMDIAWLGKARAESMTQAVLLAEKLSAGRSSQASQ